MKILLTAKFTNVNGRAKSALGGGGSGSYYSCLEQALTQTGHDVINTDEPQKCRHEKFDLIISSHEKLDIVREFKAFKVHVCHGVVPREEQPRPGADKYVAVSLEVSRHLKSLGYESHVTPQPIRIHDFREQPAETREILFIRHFHTRHFTWLKKRKMVKRIFAGQNIWGIPGIKVSDPRRPINEQIAEADMVIALGRGALEAMAMSKNVIVADNRVYIGLKGDGYLNGGNVKKSMEFNYNGKAFGYEATRQWLEGEIRKYDPADGKVLYEHVKSYHDSTKIANAFLLMSP